MADIEDAAGKAAAKPKIAVKLPRVSDEDVAGFKAAYMAHVAEREAEGLPPLALEPKQALLLHPSYPDSRPSNCSAQCRAGTMCSL